MRLFRIKEEVLIMNVFYFRRRSETLVRCHRDQTLKAAAFTSVLLLWMLVSVTLAVSSIDRFVVATEMNTNGLVEYLCLGADCENLTAMDW
ncbi:MAG: hypothetical protein B7Y80_17835 [Hyphomicrobium sp. 32-62-53]|nr:MAG: hypothetical protein B7Z29_16970 [Hyphomicrobium sp. 12-62-95]OYX98010.1 MAG: hypothetical protein B7Y80_17835 [Hyphomicrobium sp. 32-62-53]